jgi:hypothetical protein
MRNLPNLLVDSFLHRISFPASYRSTNWPQGWHPLSTYPPTHWFFWVGGQLKKPRKTHFCVKII